MSSEAITVVLAADKKYARALTVAATSVILTLEPHESLQLCVLDMGIDPVTRGAMREALQRPNVEVRWIDSIQGSVEHLPNTFGFITSAGYARLWIPEVLPDVKRALYLDCDTLARRSVGELFRSDMDGKAALGSPDVQSPFVSSTYAVPYWHEYGRPADELNYNSGVMLIDVDQWRELGVRNAALAYLTDGRHVFAQDQEAINAVLPGRIGQMDPRWNQQSELWLKQYEVIQPFDKEMIELTKKDPSIIHYCNSVKPWHYGNDHPFIAEWYAVLDETPFAGWRPSHGRHVAKQTYLAGLRTAGRTARQLGLRH